LTGVVALPGGIPNSFLRSPQFVPYLLTGSFIPPDLLKTHLFTEVASADKVLEVALGWAKKVTTAAPDAVWVTKEQINLTKEGKGVWGTVNESLQSQMTDDLFQSANHHEGLNSFVEVSSVHFFQVSNQILITSIYHTSRNALPYSRIRSSGAVSCRTQLLNY
jgi:hypothetical protein